MSEKQRPMHWMCAALYGHFGLWAHSLRTVLMLIFALMMNYMLVRSEGARVMNAGYQVHMGEMLFSYLHQGFNMIMASLAFFVMMSEIPKQVPYQKYSTLRMTRRRWLASLMLFCMMIVLLYLALMIVSSVLFSLPYVTPGGGWSDLERLAADPDLIYEPPYIPAYVTSSLSPLAAGVIAGAVLFLFWTAMAFIILLSSLYRAPNVGIVICVAFITGSIVILVESIPSLILPDQFSTMGRIAARFEEHKLTAVMLSMGGWLLLNGLLAALMDRRVQRMDIEFSGKE